MTVSSSAAGITSDSYFNLVSLLLPGNGTNGAQNNTFLDSSASPLTVTRNGSVTQGAFSPFTFGSGTQTDGYYSGYFDGTGDYLTVANNAAFDLGSGDATIETWIFPTSSGQTCGIFDKRSSGVNYSQFPQIALVSGAFVAYVSYSGSSWAGTINGATPAVNTWTHVAFVRSGNTWTLYVNGVVSGTPFTASGSVYTSTDSLVIGASTTTGTNPFVGYISNARIVKGTAVYTSTFTAPTTPLTAITNTSLLTCQSSRFTDNSTNAFAITVNGNSQPSLTNPFNVTNQPVQAWSNYFDGTGDYLTAPSNSAFAFGTGDFSIEAWVYPQGTQNYNTIAATNSSGSYQTGRWWFEYSQTRGFAFVTGSVSYVQACTVNLNVWTHIAVTRSGTSLRFFLNGVQQGSTQTASDDLNTTTTCAVGALANGVQPFTGYISNARIVKGSAVYTANFTVPTTPLTATANTSLLTCQSNRFIDNSTNAFAITRAGDTSVQPFSPFDPTAAYSTSSIGASMYFDGASKLTTSASINISGVFTIESWFNSTNTGGWFFTIGNFPVYIDVSAGTVTLDKSSVGNQLVTTANEQVKGSNCWKHLAITRDGSGLIRVFVNGVFLGSVSTSYSAGTLNGLGQYASYGGAWLGYACDFRVVVGTALYTSAFTPPTAPLTAVSGTAILLSGINAGIYDAAAKNVLETVGSAQISTAQSKFGGSSMLFDGNGDYLQMTSPSRLLINWWTQDFTIEGWIYPTTLTNTSYNQGGNQTPTLIGNMSPSTDGNYWSFGPITNGTLRLYYYNGSATFAATSTETVTINQWNHIALTNVAGVGFKYWVNGIGSSNITVSGTPLAGSELPLMIGWKYYPAGSAGFTGYIDDVRITTGLARYTANFTPPTAAFPTQ